jgi:hypothetical protein
LPSDDDILAAMEADLGPVEAPLVHPVSEWTSLELIDRLEALDGRLSAMGELLDVQTDEGRALHSERGAIIVQMRERNLR